MLLIILLQNVTFLGVCQEDGVLAGYSILDTRLIDPEYHIRGNTLHQTTSQLPVNPYSWHMGENWNMKLNEPERKNLESRRFPGRRWSMQGYILTYFTLKHRERFTVLEPRVFYFHLQISSLLFFFLFFGGRGGWGTSIFELCRVQPCWLALYSCREKLNTPNQTKTKQNVWLMA